MSRFRMFMWVLAAMLWAGPASAQHLRSSVTSAGGNQAASATHRLGSTVGQSIAGRAVGAASTVGIGFWHQVGAFDVLAPPGVPALAAPEDGAADLPTAVELVWNAVPEAVSYDLQVATVEDFSETVVEEAGVAATVYEAAGLAEGTLYFWRVRAVNEAGASAYAEPFTFTTASPVANEDGSGLPEVFALRPAYPNPFSAHAVLRYDVPEAGRVRLTVYDALGREVAVLVDGDRVAGAHEAVLDAAGLASGLYLVHMTAAEFSQTRRLTLLR